MGSSAGQGSVSFSPKVVPAGAPFPAGSADNGLSVDPITGRIVLGDELGGSLSTFQNSRYLDVNSNSFNIYNGVNGQFTIDPVNDAIRLGDFTNAILPFLEIDNFGNRFRVVEGLSKLDLDKSLQSYRIGDLEAEANGTLISISDLAQVITASTLNFTGLSLDFPSHLFQLGDVLNAFQSSKLNVEAGRMTYEALGVVGLEVNPDSFRYQLGDVDGTANQSKLIIDDLSAFANIALDGSLFLALDASTGVQIGDIDGLLTKAIINIDTVNEVMNTEFASKPISGFFIRPADNFFEFGDRDDRTAILELKGNDEFAQISINNTARLKLDVLNSIYQMGDIDNAVNGNIISVDDFANKINVYNAANTAIMNINGVDGFTGTVTPVTSITVNGGIVTDVT